MKSGEGWFGHGMMGGSGSEFDLHQNQVIGMFVGAPTTGSTITTLAHDFNVNIDKGILAVDGVVLEFAAQADYSISVDATGPPTDMGTGYSIVYSIVAYKSLGDAALRLMVVAGAVALDAAALPPAQATIEALLAADTPWFELGRTKVKRTAATTLTQTYDNSVRPMQMPDAV